MARKKLMPVNPGAKVKGRKSFARQSGARMPMDGAGARGTGRPKLNPSNGAKSFTVRRGQSGPRGPKDGVRS